MPSLSSLTWGCGGGGGGMVALLWFQWHEWCHRAVIVISVAQVGPSYRCRH